MRNTWKVWLASALMSGSLASFAQAPAAAPAAPAAAATQTFVCKDGSSMSAATSKGACAGRKGIDKEATAKAAAAKPAPAAPGTADGKVWVNAKGSVYHCPGSQHYGKTKDGKYMTEAEAKAAGAHASRNKACAG